MAEQYSWVVNNMKFVRAQKEFRLKNEGKPDDEEAIKAIYVRMAGLLLDEAPEQIQEQIKITRRGKK